MWKSKFTALHPRHWLISTQVTDAALAPEGSNEAQRPVDISGALGMERDVRRAGGRELLDLDIYDFFATGELDVDGRLHAIRSQGFHHHRTPS